MNVNMNTSTALASMAGQATGDAVGVSVLKKALAGRGAECATVDQFRAATRKNHQ